MLQPNFENPPVNKQLCLHIITRHADIARGRFVCAYKQAGFDRTLPSYLTTHTDDEGSLQRPRFHTAILIMPRFFFHTAQISQT